MERKIKYISLYLTVFLFTILSILGCQGERKPVRPSPIDISNYQFIEKLNLSFRASVSDFRVEIENDNYLFKPQSTNNIILNGTPLELKQFYFMHPSAHTLNEKVYDGEIHLVHQSENGRLYNIAILIDREARNSTIHNFFHSANEPNIKNQLTQLDVYKTILPSDRSYYQYFGSLTIPPYNEPVYWMVMKHPIGITESQLYKLINLIPRYTRKTQDRQGRKITYVYQ
ncbi:MAG: carbonic anhydrase family protein [Hyphomicrobiales bacterium]